MVKVVVFMFGGLMIFLYLCIAEEHLIIMQSNNYQTTISLSPSPSSPSGRSGGVASMGRTELAQRYFPYIQPQSAWLKLKSLLLDDPSLAHLATLRRRTFLPAEVAQIYASLGHP